MAGAFKVKLDDGMEVGPLDGEMLRSWYQQGMIKRETKIRAKGSKQWVPLGDTFDISDWGAAGSSTGSAVARSGSRAVADDSGEDDEPLAESGPQVWRTYAACAVFFLLACAAAYFSLFPAVWKTPPDVPWMEIALGFVALGLLLVRGWDPARKIVRVVTLLLTLGLFPLAEVLIFRGVPWRSLVVLVPAVAMGFGLFFFLSARYKPWPRVALNLFWIAAGAAGVILLGAFPPPAMAEWMAAPSPLPAALAPAMLPGARASMPPASVPTAPTGADRVGAGDIAPSAMPSAAAATAGPRASSSAPDGAPTAAAVMQEVPLLSPAAAEAVRQRAVFAPEDAFRRSYEMAGNGVAALSAGERQALGQLMAVTYGNIPAADRRRLEAYMTGIRGGQVSTPEQNREMSALMRTAMEKLPPLQRSQLQALYEKAVLAAR